MDTENTEVNDTENEAFQLIVYRVDNRYIILAEGLERELSDIIGVIKEIMGDNNTFVVNVNKEEYDEKKEYIDVLTDYIDSILKS